jgi:hypothetical protein
MSQAMRRELDGVKSEVKGLGAAVHALGNRVDSLGDRVGSLEEASHRMMVAVAKMTGDMADIKAAMGNMATKADISALNARMDGFSGLLEDSRRRLAVHSDILLRPNERLSKLERRRNS